MAYPRRCIGCGVEYSSFPSQEGVSHITLNAEDGGTTSPWLADRPGRLLDLGCKACGAVYRWDYFGMDEDGRLGTVVGLLRGPVAGWGGVEAFVVERGRGYRGERRAS